MVLHQLIFYEEEAWLKRKDSMFRFTCGIQIPLYEKPPRSFILSSHHKSYFLQDYEQIVRSLYPLYFVGTVCSPFDIEQSQFCFGLVSKNYVYHSLALQEADSNTETRMFIRECLGSTSVGGGEEAGLGRGRNLAAVQT